MSSTTNCVRRYAVGQPTRTFVRLERSQARRCPGTSTPAIRVSAGRVVLERRRQSGTGRALPSRRRGSGSTRGVINTGRGIEARQWAGRPTPEVKLYPVRQLRWYSPHRVVPHWSGPDPIRRHPPGVRTERRPFPYHCGVLPRIRVSMRFAFLRVLKGPVLC